MQLPNTAVSSQTQDWSGPGGRINISVVLKRGLNWVKEALQTSFSTPPASSPAFPHALGLLWFSSGSLPAAAAKSLQSCPTLWDPIDSSPPGSPSLGFSRQELEWVATSFSNAWKWKVKVKSLSRVGLFATPGTAAHQAPPSMGFSRQEY